MKYKDKLDHLVYSYAIMHGLNFVFNKVQLNNSMYWAAGIVFALLLLKEYADKKSNDAAIAEGKTPYHGVERMDILAGMLGIGAYALMQ